MITVLEVSTNYSTSSITPNGLQKEFRWENLQHFALQHEKLWIFRVTHRRFRKRNELMSSISITARRQSCRCTFQPMIIVIKWAWVSLKSFNDENLRNLCNSFLGRCYVRKPRPTPEVSDSKTLKAAIWLEVAKNSVKMSLINND